MLAARAGAESVVACEVTRHMCEVGDECVALNGFGTRILMLHKDARRLTVDPKPDGTPPDMGKRYAAWQHYRRSWVWPVSWSAVLSKHGT